MTYFRTRMVSDALQKLVHSKKYIAIALTVSVSFIFGYALLTNGRFILHVIEHSNYTLGTKLTSLIGLMYGVFLNMTLSAQLTTAAVALLGGINVALLVMRFDTFRTYDTKAQGTTIAGLLVGTFAAGCSACATGLIALLGSTGALAFIPFEAAGLRVISIGLLLLSLGFVSHSLSACKKCEV